MKKIFFIIFGILIMGIGVSLLFFSSKTGKTNNVKEVYFIVEKGATLQQIGKKMEQKLVLTSSEKFIRYAQKKDFLKANEGGNYIIKPNTSFTELLSKITEEKSDFSIISIPEGFSLNQIAEKLEKNNLMKKDNLLHKKLSDIENNTVVTSNENVVYELEGYIHPDTYYIPTGTSEEKIIKMMFDPVKNVFSEKERLRIKELKLSINEVMTIASMIEKEAINNKERKTISGVIYNRLKKDMLLQVDPTVIYSITKGERHIEKLYYNQLKVDSKYNTYLYKGLPPGPIASPGSASIEAALYPESHEYLYYVAAGKEHVFSKTYEEHLNNVKKYIK